MKMAPITALGWEIFGWNRSALLMNAAIGAALGVAVNVVGLAGPMSIMLLVSFSLLLASSFSYIDLNTRSSRAGFPRHILVLPVATWMLALVPILGGAVFISAFVLLWLRFLTSIRLSFVEQLALAGAITALSCWMQAMSWELIRVRLAKLAVLVIVSLLATLSLVSLLSEHALLLGRTGGTVTLLMTMSCGYFFAWMALVRSRRGDAGEAGPSNKRLRTHGVLTFGNSRMPELASGVEAQKWYESRVFGRLLPICLMIVCTLSLSMLLFDAVRSKPSGIEIGLVLLAFFMVSPLVGSAYAWKNPQLPRAMLAPFFAALPLDDVELAFAKLRASARSHLLGVMIVLVTIAAIIVLSDNNAKIEGIWTNLVAHQGTVGAYCVLLLLALFAAVLTWMAGALLMAAAFYFAAVQWKNGALKYLVVFLGLLAFLKYTGWFLLNRVTLQLLLVHAHTIAWVLLAVVLILATLSFRDYRRSNPLAALGKVLAGFVAMTAISLVLIWQVRMSAQLHWALSCFAITTSLGALIPILRLPVEIASNRHR